MTNRQCSLTDLWKQPPKKAAKLSEEIDISLRPVHSSENIDHNSTHITDSPITYDNSILNDNPWPDAWSEKQWEEFKVKYEWLEATAKQLGKLFYFTK